MFWTETPTKAASCNALRKASASKLDKAKSNFLHEGQLVVVKTNYHSKSLKKLKISNDILDEKVLRNVCTKKHYVYVYTYQFDHNEQKYQNNPKR